MRRIILAMALVALAPIAFAQTSGNQGTRSSPGASGPPGSMNSMGRTGPSSAAPMIGSADPGNCGTPDEPKPCPPMPHRALQNFPTNR
jgi:hypothetical protein